MTYPTSGVCRIEDLAWGGAIAWLYGPTDLDDVLLQVAAHMNAAAPGEGWAEQEWLEPPAKHPEAPGDDVPASDPAWAAWHAACDAWRRAGTYVLAEDHPTGFVFRGDTDEVYPGWYRSVPCTGCDDDDDHDWDVVPSGPGDGACLAVLVPGSL